MVEINGGVNAGALEFTWRGCGVTSDRKWLGTIHFEDSHLHNSSLVWQETWPCMNMMTFKLWAFFFVPHAHGWDLLRQTAVFQQLLTKNIDLHLKASCSRRKYDSILSGAKDEVGWRSWAKSAEWGGVDKTLDFHTQDQCLFVVFFFLAKT